MIRFSDVYAEYALGEKTLKGVNMNIEDGEFVFIVGPSGAGKSTLLRLLTAELKPCSGVAEVNGYSITKIKRRKIPALRRTIGVVYQDFKLIPRMTIFDNVALSLRITGQYNGKVVREKVLSALKMVGIGSKASRYPYQLSGGEQQRAAIARAIVHNPGMIIADEPTGNLDPDSSVEIMELLTTINGNGTTVVVITHDKELVNRFHHRVILIADGHIAAEQESGYLDKNTMTLDETELTSAAPAEDGNKEEAVYPEKVFMPVSQPEDPVPVGKTEVPETTVPVPAEEDTGEGPKEGTRFISEKESSELFQRILMEEDDLSNVNESVGTEILKEILDETDRDSVKESGADAGGQDDVK